MKKFTKYHKNTEEFIDLPETITRIEIIEHFPEHILKGCSKQEEFDLRMSWDSRKYISMAPQGKIRIKLSNYNTTMDIMALYDEINIEYNPINYINGYINTFRPEIVNSINFYRLNKCYYSKYNIRGYVKLCLQDQCRTLKIFIKDG